MNYKNSLIIILSLLINICFSQEKVENKVIHFDQVEEPPFSSDCKAKWKVEKKREVTKRFVTMHILKKFNTNLGSELGLSGINRIFIDFIIDKSGEVCEINAKGPHEKLEKESIKVISKLKKFTPGYHENRPVRTYFETSITFRVDD